MIDDVLNEMMGGGKIERFYDMREAKSIEDFLQEPDLDPMIGTQEFYINREVYERWLAQGVCPMCDSGIDETDVDGIWRYAKPCGCRVGYAGPPIDPAIIAEWDATSPDV